jgi:pSer/pThr/pTyr-binding forkhead associated (FHA) protein
MIDQLLLLFQALFILLLYLFIWRVVRTASRDLRLPQESFLLSPAPALADGHVQGRLVAEASPSLQIGQTFEIGAAPITIGRSDENAIPLPADDYASGEHARIETLRDGLWIVDLGSTNGTFVNGEQIDGRERLEEGDVVKVGGTELRVAR